MQFSVQLKVVGLTDELERLMRRFNVACHYVAGVAHERQEFNHIRLRRMVYGLLRREFNSQTSDMIVRKVSTAYANRRLRSKCLSFAPLGAIPLCRHTLSYKKDGLSISTLEGRRTAPFETREWARDLPLSNKLQAKLVFQDGCFYVHQPVEWKEPSPAAPTDFLGVDLGIKNIAVDSDGEVFGGAKLNSYRRRAARLRAKLQSKGTKSAKRLLKKRRRKEKRFARDTNHVISKKLVQKARDTLRGIALEDLAGIRERASRARGKKRITAKVQRTALSSWGFFQLRSFIDYKARLRGIPVVLVDPRNTSRTCSQCGFVAKENRKTQSVFRCGRCGHAAHADHNAARVIADHACRGAGLHPHAAAGRKTG